MTDRNNIEDIFEIIEEDFNWLNEDINDHIKILKDEAKELIEEDLVEELEGCLEELKDLKKILEKIDDVRNEYISITKGEEQDQLGNDTEYDYLDDWTGTDPIQVELFGIKYDVKYWRDILLILMEELNKRDKGIVADVLRDDKFKGKKRIPLTYEHNKIDKEHYKKTSYGLYVLVNDNANTIYNRCIRILKIAGYKEQNLKIKLNDSAKEETNIENSSTDNESIKLAKKYASISIDKPLFKTIINSIVNRKNEYGTDYIEPRKIAERYESLILKDTKYTTAYHVVINIVKYLVDSHFLDNYGESKKGKYIVIDDNSLKIWLANNI